MLWNSPNVVYIWYGVNKQPTRNISGDRGARPQKDQNYSNPRGSALKVDVFNKDIRCSLTYLNSLDYGNNGISFHEDLLPCQDGLKHLHVWNWIFLLRQSGGVAFLFREWNCKLSVHLPANVEVLERFREFLDWEIPVRFALISPILCLVFTRCHLHTCKYIANSECQISFGLSMSPAQEKNCYKRSVIMFCLGHLPSQNVKFLRLCRYLFKKVLCNGWSVIMFCLGSVDLAYLL